MPKKISQPKEYWNDLAIFVLNCRRLNLASSLENIDKVEDFMLAREAGIGFLSGDVIGPYSESPKHMSHISWQDLIAK